MKRVQHYYDVNKNKAHRNFGENWLRVLIAFGEVENDKLTPYTAREAMESENKWIGWRPIRKELERLGF